MKCEFGYCLVCEKEIARKCGECSSKTPTGEYTEVTLNWSNGSKMQTAVCIECAPEKIWKADKREMTQAIWDAWDKAGAKYDKGVTLV
jgi:hypothetical protein